MDAIDIPHWVVGDKRIYNQMEAWEEIVSSRREFRFYFYDHIYDRYDWSVEPEQSWEELVHHRCLQLRQKYRKLSLWYSGGRDSHHILRSFIKHNIPLDELLLCHYKLNPVRSAEYYDWQLPLAMKYRQINPQVKITTVDVDEKVYSRYYSSDLVNSKYFSSAVGFYQPSDYEWHTMNLCNVSDSSTGFITGIEKPILYLNNGKIYHRFMDKIIELFRGAMSEHEMFYFAPELPELYIKQCHILAKYIKLKYPARDQSFFHNFISNPKSQYYSELCTACGRGPALDESVPANNGKGKYLGSHKVFDHIIDVAKKERFESIDVWEDWMTYWTKKTPEAFDKNYRDGGTTGIWSKEKFIMNYSC